MEEGIISSHTNSSRAGLLRWIAAFKLLKAALLVFIGIRVFKMVHGDIASQVQHLVSRLGLDPGSRHINDALEKLIYTPPRKIRELGLASFFYAGLFITEGTGLWMLKRWAEWFTVVITGSLVPVEFYEIYRHPTLIKAGVILLNLAIVIYLIYRIRHEHAGTFDAVR